MNRTGSVEFGAWLKARLGRRPYGQMAAYVGVSTSPDGPSTVSRWVTGESAPEYRNRLGVATYLGVEPAEVHAFFPDEKAAGRAPHSVRGFDIHIPVATVRLTKPEAVNRFLAFLGQLEEDGLTEREERSAAADEIDIPERAVAGRGERDADGGRAGAGDPV